jgi:hypothetical protein
LAANDQAVAPDNGARELPAYRSIPFDAYLVLRLYRIKPISNSTRINKTLEKVGARKNSMHLDKFLQANESLKMDNINRLKNIQSAEQRNILYFN